jgi:hypothetical protein
VRPARPEELTDRGDEHDYLVLYPSGQRFSLRGVFSTLAIDAEVHIGVRVGARLVILDPRAVVVRDGLIIRDPRSHPPTSPEMRAWLSEHPEWPAIATEATP